MAREPQGPQVLTANRLVDGIVVYWQGGVWREALAAAEIFKEAADAKTALEGAAAAVRDRVVVNPYLFEVRFEDGVAVPVKERERVRAAGPTIHPDLGKQADAELAPHFPQQRPPKPPVPAEGPEAFDVSV